MGRRSVKDITTPLYNDCTACDLFVGFRSIPTGRGVRRNSVLFLNDITSSSDVNNQTAFCGRRSVVIRKFVELYGLEASVEYTNLILCQTSEFDPYAYRKCKDHLFKFIGDTQPAIIVTIGKTVYQAFIGGDLYKQRLYKPFRIGKAIILAIEHPYKLKMVNESYKRYITAFNIISELYSIINPYHIRVHHDTSEHLDI